MPDHVQWHEILATLLVLKFKATPERIQKHV